MRRPGRTVSCSAARAFLVRQRTTLKNRIHAYLTAENLHCPVVDLYSRAGRAWLTTVALSPSARRQVDLLRELIDLLDRQVYALDKHIQRHVRHDAVAQRLQTIPGVGPFGALLLQAEIGPITRFRGAHELAACAGLTPSTHSSGDKTRHGRVGRGSVWLKWILIEAVQALSWRPARWAITIRSCCARRGSRKRPSPQRGSSAPISIGW